jgi:hypothetical protein
MTRRLQTRDFGKSIVGFDGIANADVTNNASGLDFGATTNFTVAFWTKTNQRISGRTLISRRSGTVLASIGWLIGPATNGNLFVEVSDGTVELGSASIGGQMSDGMWHSCVVTFDRTNGVVKGYVDGVTNGNTLNISTVGDISTGATINYRVGRDGGGNNKFAGQVVEPIVWEGLLTEEEIEEWHFTGTIPQPENRKIHWKVIDDAVVDISGNGKDGTETGVFYDLDAPAKLRATATSRSTASNRVKVRDMGTALRFGATGANVISNNPILTNFATTSYTISAWVKAQLVTSNVSSDAQHIFASSGTTSPFIAFSLRNGNYLLRYFDSGEDRQIAVKQIPNTFVLLTSVFDKTDSNIKLYINGVLRGTQSVTSYENVLSGTLVRFGFQTGTTSLNGIIDEPRIWSRALTAQEVSDLYFNDIVPQDGLVAEYLFNEASGTTALDTSGNGNDGTITGATYTTDVPIIPRDTV